MTSSNKYGWVAVKHCHEPIHVRVGDGPMRFVWRGRQLTVREIQGQWCCSLQWWVQPESSGDLLAEQEVWRVEAGSGPYHGIYELAHRTGASAWVLVAFWPSALLRGW